jgi:hypothetical protein
VTAGLLAPLTRPELDTLITEMEHAEMVAHIALVNAPLLPAGLVYDAAGVSADIMCVYLEALDESMRRYAAEVARA